MYILTSLVLTTKNTTNSCHFELISGTLVNPVNYCKHNFGVLTSSEPYAEFTPSQPNKKHKHNSDLLNFKS